MEESKMKMHSFTLAEVLITLGIVVVVAALTIPGLVTKIQSDMNARKAQVTEKKLIESLNLLNHENGLNAGYSSSEEFVRALSKHLKMTQICSKNNLASCFNYDNIKYNNTTGSESNIRLSELSDPGAIKITGNGFIDTAGFVTADGTPFIISYNLNCSSDPDTVYKSIHDCVAGIYDTNGSSPPNKFGYIFSDGGGANLTSDLRGFNGARFGCGAAINGICVVNGMTKLSQPASCDDYVALFGGNGRDCYYPDGKNVSNNDYWTAAYKYCHNMGARIPNQEELAKIAFKLYGDDSIPVGHHNSASVSVKDKSVLDALGMNVGSSFDFYVWSDYQNRQVCHARHFRPGITNGLYIHRNSNVYVICIE